MTDQAKPITFEVGEYYIHSGVKHLCVFVSENSGLFVYNMDIKNISSWIDKKDISEWREVPEVDWSLYAKWHVYVAMNKDNLWYAYDLPPKLGTLGYWLGAGEHIPQEYAPKFSGDWKDSLIERPS